ncbi:hypothetical protein M9Y10_006072 [Tritrichomonas musculus]|uniref:Thioredoxin domain-containing protein n=1 Tax=Tritrichomonas musculus TaxID=1915356 RepID=A0ABR2JD75_9EUKA
MLFLVFFSFGFAYHIFPYPILTLTDDNFPTIIDKRSPGSVYFVMFHGDHCPACRMTYPALTTAAKKSAELVNFCHVDCSRNPKLAERFRIMSIPTFIIFNNGKPFVYNGQRTPHDFIVAATKYIPDKTEKVNSTNIGDFTQGVIMFDDKKKVPALWRAISTNLTQRGIRIGYSTDKDLISEFESEESRFIAYVDKDGKREELPLSSKYSDVYATIAEKFGITPNPTPEPKSNSNSKSSGRSGSNQPTEIKNFKSITEFNVICKGTSRICIVEMEKEPSEQYLAIRKKFQKARFSFNYCSNSEIFGDMQKGLYIFHPKKDMCIFCENYDQLSENLERILDGSAKWTKMNKIPSEL